MAVLVLSIMTLLLTLMGVVGGVIIVVHAFQHGGAVAGILCLIVPFYVIYYGLARFDHPRRWLVLGLWLGSGAANIVCQAIIMAVTASDGPAYYY
jgi:hypothetical protein